MSSDLAFILTASIVVPHIHYATFHCSYHGDTHNVLVNIQSWYTPVLIEATAHLVMDTSTCTTITNHLEKPSVHFPHSFLFQAWFWDTHNVLVNIQSRYTPVLIEATAHLVMDTSMTTTLTTLNTPICFIMCIIAYD